MRRAAGSEVWGTIVVNRSGQGEQADRFSFGARPSLSRRVQMLYWEAIFAHNNTPRTFSPHGSDNTCADMEWSYT